MLGSLARMLRILGYYVIYGKYDDDELIEISKEREAWLLTRDVELSKRYDKAVLVRSSSLEGQLREIVKLLPEPDEDPFSICPLCGTPLQKAEREAMKARVYEPVYCFNDSFYLCPRCSQIYWKGSQYNALLKRLRPLLREMGFKDFP